MTKCLQKLKEELLYLEALYLHVLIYFMYIQILSSFTRNPLSQITWYRNASVSLYIITNEFSSDLINTVLCTHLDLKLTELLPYAFWIIILMVTLALMGKFRF